MSLFRAKKHPRTTVVEEETGPTARDLADFLDWLALEYYPSGVSAGSGDWAKALADEYLARHA